MDETTQRLREMFPRASASFIEANSQLCSEADKPTSRKALVGAVERKEKVSTRVGVSYVLYRCRLLDPDAVHGATKVCTDVLQQIGIITGDGPGEVYLTVEQEKVSHYADQKTIVEITYH